ncbi:MAG TPA: FAD-dependent oxidoreductase [Actinophytocola sp.]|jgi:glycine/D-amino acid oxidase-like deaminating enzyme/nitrite reductase/ring-hydroxylating ferredoxin subunit|uniref:FAD-dependent oxidoreductase n=1 Tax=Actinophytocola sp. TaxID=1872138 RepID=UPI002F9361AA
MQTTTAQHSLWLADTPDAGYPSLSGTTRCDVAVVGGGWTGLTTALLLKRAGVRVAVVEAARVGAGVSGNNTAKVSALQATMYSRIAREHGAAAAADYARASTAGVELVAELAAREGIDCDPRRRTAVTYASTEQERDAVEAEAEAAREAGLEVTLDVGPDLPFPTYGAVGLDEQLLLHPRRYAAGLAAAVEGDGCRVFERSRVRQVREGKPCRVVTAEGTVTADRVVIATHYPILDRGVFFARLEATRAYCVAARLREGTPPAVMAISAGSPAWSTSASADLLILAGQSHPAGRREAGTRPYDELTAFARRHWEVEEITHRWSAQDPIPYDHLPMIGTYRPGLDRVYVATGYQKWGLSTSAFAAIILADLLTGKPNPWADRFSPHRLSVRAAPTLARLNTTVAANLVGDRLRAPDTTTPADVPPGEARVVRDRQGKTGVYRDEDGKLHAVSLRCTHLGCLLRFNDAERSWDCPCHGSRFDVDGAVLEGPATRPLPRREPPGNSR